MSCVNFLFGCTLTVWVQHCLSGHALFFNTPSGICVVLVSQFWWFLYINWYDIIYLILWFLISDRDNFNFLILIRLRFLIWISILFYHFIFFLFFKLYNLWGPTDFFTFFFLWLIYLFFETNFCFIFFFELAVPNLIIKCESLPPPPPTS